MNSDDKIKFDEIQIENSEPNNQTNSDLNKKKIDSSHTKQTNTEKSLSSKENTLQNINNENQKIHKKRRLIFIISITIIISLIIIFLIFLIYKLSKKSKNEKKSEDETNPENINIESNSEEIKPEGESKTEEESKIEETEEETKIEETEEESKMEEEIEPEEEEIIIEEEVEEEKKPIYDKINIEDIEIEEVNSLIGGRTEENYKMIMDSLNDLDVILNNIEKTNMNEIKMINYDTNNLSFPSFFSNFSDSDANKIAIAKEDINLYNEICEELSEKMNEFSEINSESIKELIEPINNLKNELEKISDHFEETMKNFGLPFILEQYGLIDTSDSNLRRLDLNEIMEEYKNQVAQFNDLYNKFLTFVVEEVNSINDAVNEFPNFARELNDYINDEITNFTDFVENMEINNLHNNLITMKESFLKLKDNLNERINKINESISNLENSNNKMKNDLLNFQNEFDELSENITELSNLIINETAKTYEIEIIENNKYSNFIVDTIINSLSEPLIDIKEIEIEVMNILIVIRNETIIIETKTSLDLLFIVDLTGSMGPYINEIKKNLIYIMKRIIDQSPGIDIYLGFIGYRDIYEKYIDLDFTKNYSYIENQISGVFASGGGDFPEDVAWAFERALEKDWKSDAKFIVFVADAPGHGRKYGPYDEVYFNGIPGRKEIEESVKELAENNVSMFCFRIHSITDKMFSIFKNIYDNYSWNIFELVDISGHVFTDEIVNSCNNYYLKQKTKGK